ncbi:chemosensory pili system protein ChpA (sensor histidine kinase/response regulator) [Comamonas sp. BIGb0152]|uniref:hybrid sensor histidine kinase/response regulator n=1 Tax=Comamonas sp. BIGb0152 TaxID=2940601 RepID=UPI00286D7E62|nr:Hpt domain-containing protein [Comamonas sp. BIGb0152]MCS4295151.1 chemosensory pili system protein ChpA (sensor histidine kinase/response regulator) [Comamonas sp. BIGb0152]
MAWINDEVRRSLESTVKALLRYSRDVETAKVSDLEAVDNTGIRVAKQYLHQVKGALQMVGVDQAAELVALMEVAAQRFAAKPHLCTEKSVALMERTSFALLEYLSHVLKGRSVSFVALFPQYKEMQAFVGVERVHPADLWHGDQAQREPLTPVVAALPLDRSARQRLDSDMLQIIKSGDSRAAQDLTAVCLGLAQAQSQQPVKIFWKVAAGFFDAMAYKLLNADLYAKRTASRVIMQFAAHAKGSAEVDRGLQHELSFFCAIAQGPDEAKAAVLQAVRVSLQTEALQGVNYGQERFGLYDPAVLAQARKRLESAAELWSSLADGDRYKIKPVADQFHLIRESLHKLHIGADELGAALGRVTERLVASGTPPSTPLAMEVATAVLYLQANLESLDVKPALMRERADRLAQRLDHVLADQPPEPLETWVEELYRRVSDHQTMGSVVDELHSTLAEAEKHLDQYFRNPDDVSMLGTVTGAMSQMRGVLSVLGLDQAVAATQHLRTVVDQLAAGQVSDDDKPVVFEKLGNSLGALGFLLDMLGYQRTLARKLFIFDATSGELRIVMGTQSAGDVAPAPAAPVLAASLQAPEEPEDDSVYFAPTIPAPLFDASPAPAPKAPAVLAPDLQIVVPAAQAVPVLETQDALDEELLEIFLEEAQSVVQTGGQALQSLRRDPADAEALTTLRRAFHTLKGSSRMVGLVQYGDAAWSMEQVLNSWLTEHKSADAPLLALSAEALSGFGRWAEDIGAQRQSTWNPDIFRISADAMRLDAVHIPLVVPAAPGHSEPDQPWVHDTQQMALEADAPTAEADAEPEADTDTGADTVLVAADALAEPGAVVDSAQALVWPLDGIDLNLEPVEPEPAQATPSGLVPLAMAPESAEEVDFSEFAQAMAHAQAPSATPEVAQPLELQDSALDFVAMDAALEFVDDEATAQPLPAPTRLPLDLPSLDLPSEPAVATEFHSAFADNIEFADTMLPDLEPLAQAPEPLNEVLLVVPDDLVLPEALPLADDSTVARLVAEQVQVQPVAEPEPEPEPEPAPALAATDAQAEIEAPAPVEAETDAEAEIVATSDTEAETANALGVSTALFNVYLAEAENWSHNLEKVLYSWAQAPNRNFPEDAIAYAHSLAGSSSTVGFGSLSELARALEHALSHIHNFSNPEVAWLNTCQAAGSEIRKLLHQLAAGFVKPASEIVVQDLVDIANQEVNSQLHPPYGMADFDAEPSGLAELRERASDVVQPVRAFVPALASSTPVLPDLLELRNDDAIEVVDVIDPDLFLIFEEEAQELLPKLGGALREWSADPDYLPPRGEVLRHLHTLKGSARLAGAMRLGEMSHRMESEVEDIGTENLTGQDIDILLARYDGLQHEFVGLQERGNQVLAEGALPQQVPAATEMGEVVAEVAASTPAALESADAQQAAAQAADAADAAAGVQHKPLMLRMAPVRAAAGQSVRVRSQLLDRLVNEAGEVLIARSRLDMRLSNIRASIKDMSSNLERLRTLLRDVEMQAESQMQSRMALAKDSESGFDPLEFDRFTRVQELTRMMAESVNDVGTVQRNLQRTAEGAEDDLIAQGRQARELQRDLLRTRMVEFDSISERLYAIVRQISKELGKQVKLDITGASIEIDRGVLDRVTPAFEHLLRNSVAHGIELPEVRKAQGKPAVGVIAIDVRQEGNDIAVSIHDDGAGLQLDAIRNKALQSGLIAADETLDVDKAAQLIFAPGFSTATEVSELSGRGIGMDVVRTEIQSLGGHIVTTSEKNKGTRFQMVMPLTTAVTQVVMMRAGDIKFGVPANLVEYVRRVPKALIEQAHKDSVYTDNNQELPYYFAGALLQGNLRSQEEPEKTSAVVILRSATKRLAVHVDEVLGNQEVVVKNLGPQLARLPGLAGMSVLASGAIVLIYNPVALYTVYGQQIADRIAEAAVHPEVAKAPVRELAEQVVQTPLVLVVDDSITVRRVTQRLLQREGYRVALAADGLQALDRLREERPVMVLSDIEMPRMDGFELVREIRADAAMKDLPVVMITSRIADKHREHAASLGVDHYLGKPYADEVLLSLVRQCVLDGEIKAADAAPLQ